MSKMEFTPSGGEFYPIIGRRLYGGITDALNYAAANIGERGGQIVDQRSPIIRVLGVDALRESGMIIHRPEGYAVGDQELVLNQRLETAMAEARHDGLLTRIVNVHLALGGTSVLPEGLRAVRVDAYFDRQADRTIFNEADSLRRILGLPLAQRRNKARKADFPLTFALPEYEALAIVDGANDFLDSASPTRIERLIVAPVLVNVQGTVAYPPLARVPSE